MPSIWQKLGKTHTNYNDGYSAPIKKIFIFLWELLKPHNWKGYRYQRQPIFLQEWILHHEFYIKDNF